MRIKIQIVLIVVMLLPLCSYSKDSKESLAISGNKQSFMFGDFKLGMSYEEAIKEIKKSVEFLVMADDNNDYSHASLNDLRGNGRLPSMMQGYTQIILIPNKKENKYRLMLMFINKSLIKICVNYEIERNNASEAVKIFNELLGANKVAFKVNQKVIEDGPVKTFLPLQSLRIEFVSKCFVKTRMISYENKKKDGLYPGLSKVEKAEDIEKVEEIMFLSWKALTGGECVYYSEKESVFPRTLDMLLPLYLTEIPTEPFSGSKKVVNMFNGTGGWYYCNDFSSVYAGIIRPNIIEHADIN